jgi:hypothetical protein
MRQRSAMIGAFTTKIYKNCKYLFHPCNVSVLWRQNIYLKMGGGSTLILQSNCQQKIIFLQQPWPQNAKKHAFPILSPLGIVPHKNQGLLVNPQLAPCLYTTLYIRVAELI